MSKIRAVLDQIEAEQRQSVDTLVPDNIPLPELAEQVVKGKVKLTPMQQRMLIELLPFYMPKLSAVAINSLNGDDFASRLDRCIARSDRAKLIEVKAVEVEER